MGFRMENLAELYNKSKFNVFILSYRGYGKSTGTPNEEGLMLDAEATMKYVFEELDINREKVFIFGRSLGGAVAIYAAGLGHSVKGLILENTFTNISDMVSAVMPKVAWIKSLILRIDWPSAERIKTIKCPILFIAGTKDELVPPIQMQTLRNNAKASAKIDWFAVEGGDHNMTWQKAGVNYWARIRDFVDSN